MHITFSTKNRHPFIDKNIREELFSYLGGIYKNMECNPIIVGGHKDHVHILCLLSRKIALMTLIEELKTHSSKWIKTKGQQYRKFYWQNGCGGCSEARKIDQLHLLDGVHLSNMKEFSDWLVACDKSISF